MEQISTFHVMEVQNPWYDLIYTRKKRREGRKRSYLKKLLGLGVDVDPRAINVKRCIGKEIIIKFNPTKDYPTTRYPKEMIRKIVDVTEYPTLHEYLKYEGYKAVLPHSSIKTVSDAKKAYNAFFSDEEIWAAGGMVSFMFE